MPSPHTLVARSVRALLVVVATLAALALPVGTAVAVPPTPPAPPGPGAPATPPGPGTPAPGASPTTPETPAPAPEPEVWRGYPGTNSAHDTYGYPWPAAPDCNEASVGSGCVNDGLGFFQGQCTSWVAYRLGQRSDVTFSNWYLGVHWGNASEWARVARSVDVAVDKVPATGAVGWYARGHVSYVEEVNPDGSVVISEMNTDGRNGFVVHTVGPGEAGWPDRFIHVADVVPFDDTAPERPDGLAAVPAGGGVDVSWERPADDLGVTGYTVLRDGLAVAETDTPSFLDRQASPGQAYTYTVTARDAAGNVSEAAAARVDLQAAAPPRLAASYVPGTAVAVGLEDRTVVCGLLGGPRGQRLGCTRRTTDGPVVVRAGREVAWGAETSRTFLAGPDERVWFCRDLGSEVRSEVRVVRHACVPFDRESRSWGYDRVDTARAALTHPTWLVTPAGPAVCGSLADRATCSVLTEDGWRLPHRADRALPGDPLSRAFVPTRDGVAFCRVVAARAACAELGERGGWRRDVLAGRAVAPGRWTTGRTGPRLWSPGAGQPVTVEVDPEPAGPSRRALRVRSGAGAPR